MKHSQGEIVLGTIKNVKPYALFLELEDGSEALLHISEISDSYIRDIERFGSIGDQMKVKILSVDSNNGFLRVSLKQVPAEEAYTSHSNSKQSTQIDDEKEFQILKENLPNWIDVALSKIKEGK